MDVTTFMRSVGEGKMSAQDASKFAREHDIALVPIYVTFVAVDRAQKVGTLTCDVDLEDETD